MNPLKFVTLIGIPSIVLCILSYALYKDMRALPEREQTVQQEIAMADTLDVMVSENNNNGAMAPVKVALRDSIVDYGMTLLGTPYVAAACNKDGFDCSGFVYYVFQHYKINVPRTSAEFKTFGKEVPVDEVRKGDILVFLSPTRPVIGHVGIVTNPDGMETEFIHASSGGEMKVIISSLKQEGYKKRFVKAVNVLGD